MSIESLKLELEGFESDLVQRYAAIDEKDKSPKQFIVLEAAVESMKLSKIDEFIGGWLSKLHYYKSRLFEVMSICAKIQISIPLHKYFYLKLMHS